MANEALDGLRDWQKERAQGQQMAMRTWVNAVASIETLTEQIAIAEQARDDAMAELTGLGVSAELLAEWTGLEISPARGKPRRRVATAGTATPAG